MQQVRKVREAVCATTCFVAGVAGKEYIWYLVNFVAIPLIPAAKVESAIIVIYIIVALSLGVNTPLYACASFIPSR